MIGNQNCHLLLGSIITAFLLRLCLCLLVGQVSMIHITVLSFLTHLSTQFCLDTNLFFPVDFELHF